MHFEYEIPANEYVAAQLLFAKLSARTKRVGSAVSWVVAGLLFIVVALDKTTPPPILFMAIGVRWIYAGLRKLFPGRYFRRGYRRVELAGKTFKADVNEEGFNVAEDCRSWQVRWPGVQLKGENKVVFMFYSAGIVFMFGKKYLDNQQQDELRRLSGLGNTGV